MVQYEQPKVAVCTASNSIASVTSFCKCFSEFSSYYEGFLGQPIIHNMHRISCFLLNFLFLIRFPSD